MSTLWIMLKNVLVFVLLAIPGFLLVKCKLVKTSESGILSKLLSWVGMPFLVISTTMSIELTGEFTKNALLCFLIGILFTVGAFFLSALFVPTDGNPKQNGMQRFCMIFSNNGFLGIPLAQAVFGDSPAVTYLIIFNILTNILMFTLGVYLISGDKKAINLKKALLSPVIIAFALGIVLNLLKMPSRVPEVATYANHLKGIVTPLSMIILGIKMAEVDFKKIFSEKKTYFVCAIKLLFMPILGVCILFALFTINAVNAYMVLGFFTAFAMPTAGLASAFGDQYNGDTDSAVAFTLSSTLLSVTTIPVLYWLVTLIL